MTVTLMGIFYSFGSKIKIQPLFPTSSRNFLPVPEPDNIHRWLTSRQTRYDAVSALQKLMVGGGVAKGWSL